MERKQVNSFPNKKMSRRDLLLYAGIFLFTIAGITGAATYLSKLVQPKATHGFGAGPYGKGRYGK